MLESEDRYNWIRINSWLCIYETTYFSWYENIKQIFLKLAAINNGGNIISFQIFKLNSFMLKKVLWGIKITRGKHHYPRLMIHQ